MEAPCGRKALRAKQAKLANAFGKISVVAKPLWQVYLPLRQSLFVSVGH